MSINCREDLLNRQAKVNEEIKSYTCRVLVCSGTGCIASGAQKIYEEMEILCRDIDGVTVEMQKDVPHIGVIKTGCQGLCELGPLMRVEPYNYQYVHVQPEDCKEIVERTILEGQPVERLFYRDHETVCPHPDDIPFLNQQTRIVLENCGKIDAESIDEYIAAGGYQALAKALGSMTPQDVIEEVTKSGLRGRGGAGFPAGKKWSQVARQKEKIRYVVCNGDEGDPGAFMDGSVMEGDPYKMIEGMTIAAYAVGAEDGYIYVRAEYPLSVKRLRMAIEQAETNGLLGDHILGSDVNFHLHINRGAGAFVCGEGSALTASIEGNRGMPRVKPPRTVEKGLWEKPTVLNNVETYANVPKIILEGAEWFRTIGTEGSPGTKTFSLTGAIENTGLIEVPMGTTLRHIIYDIGGGVTFVVFNDIYYEGDTRTPEYSFAILQNTENGYSLMRLGMGEDLPTSDEVRLYSPFKTYNEMNWNINNVDNNNDVDFVKSYISIPILLLVISLGLIGLTACIAALVKRK